jgi:hypothetical protein
MINKNKKEIKREKQKIILNKKQKGIHRQTETVTRPHVREEAPRQKKTSLTKQTYSH